ncbi:MAG: J domain-containing protein [Nitrospinaceae bacterium]
MKMPEFLKPYNLYELLGVENFADLEQIKKGYRINALKHHPDRFPHGKKSPRKFVLCTEAYSILSDEKRRKAYDRTLGRIVRQRGRFKSEELVWQRRKSSKRVYSPKSMVDHDFNRFVDECRANFIEFLKNGSQLEVKPKVYSEKTMKGGDYEEFVQECREGFQDFLSTIPKVKTIKKRSF